MKENYIFFDIKRGSWIHIRKILSDTTLIMLERTMYLAIILLLVQHRFQNHWSGGKHNAEVRTANKFNRKQVNINVYVRFFAIIVLQENIWFFCDTYFSLHDLHFLCEYFLYLSVINFTPFTRVSVLETQSLVMLTCIW